MDEVEVVAYRAEWAAMFEREAERLQGLLPAELILALHHIGSTAVPGLAAKPVIDLMALAADLAAARTQLIEPLTAEGYAFWSDNPADDRLFFVKGLPPAPHRTHHLHIVDDPKVLDRHLAFRDVLRTDDETRRRYEALKQILAVRHRNDRDAYTKAKAEFIKATLA